MLTQTKKPHPAGVAVGANTRPNYATHDPLSDVTSRLKGVVKRHNGGYISFCPSHDDKKGRSLAISLGRENQVIMKCFAGCSVHEITSTLGLNLSDLFPPTDNLRYEKKKRSGFSAWQLLNVLRTDLIRLLIIANDLKKINALSNDDRQFVSEVVLRLNDGLTYLEGSR
jgi:hypothetical protein